MKLVRSGFSFRPTIKSQLAAVGDHYRLRGLAAAAAHLLHGANDVHAFDDAAKDNMLTVEPGGCHGGQKELRAIGVGASIGHAQQAGGGVLEGKVFIGKLHAVNRLAAGAVAAGEVAPLTHELGDDAVKAGAFEVQGLAGGAHAFFAGTQGTEVLGGFRGDISPQFHDDAACGSATNGDVKKYSGISCFCHS